MTSFSPAYCITYIGWLPYYKQIVRNCVATGIMKEKVGNVHNECSSEKGKFSEKCCK